MAGAPTLTSIRALARAGATDLAWRLFEEAGFGAVADDPAVLALRGRLQKDRALGLTGAERSAAALAASAAYEEAARLQLATYPLINAATLSLIGGDRKAAATLARRVLALLSSGEAQPDTPYYLAATRAEAELLLGSTERAEELLAEAIDQAPLAWEDHAVTLRQFSVILDSLGLPSAWIDRYRPPRAMHFAGQMALRNDAQADAIDALLARENVGFGFGSLAAGADILIAERLLSRGAEVHVILPDERSAFFRRSVAPYQGDWSRRFDAVLDRAASLQEIVSDVGGASDLAVELADEVAMGRSVMHARLLQTEPIQLLLGPLRDGSPAGHNSARVAEIWASGGRRQHLLETSGSHAGERAPRAAQQGIRLVAILAVSLTDQLLRDPLADLVDRLPLLPRPSGLIAAPQWRGDGVTLAFSTPREAAAAGFAIAASLGATGPIRIAGHFGLVAVAPDPLGVDDVLLGETVSLTQRIMAATPSTAVYVSEAFAAALAASGATAINAELVGELPPKAGEEPMPLYALRDQHSPAA